MEMQKYLKQRQKTQKAPAKKTYSVYMINFDNLYKGTFSSKKEALARARALGYECAIWISDESNKESSLLCVVLPLGGILYA